MNCIVVDDEYIALEGMADYVRKTPFLKLVGKCKNAYEAIELISTSQVDLVFLDINMPELTGIEMINSVAHSPLVVFVTAYSNYALKGFELDAVDYILKPVAYEKFLKASQKAYKLFKLFKGHDLAVEDDFIYIKVDKKYIKVEIADILFVEGLKDYIRIHTQKEKYVTYLSLNKIIKTLPPNKFMQVHKSFIVATTAIAVVDGNTIQINNERIPIGRSYKDAFFESVVYKKFLKK